MLQHKDTHKISELKSGFTHRWFEPDFIFGSLKCFKLSSMCPWFGSIKQKGYSFTLLFSILLSMPFLSQQTVHGLLNSSMKRYIDARKDAFYRLKNLPTRNWRDILWMFSTKFIKASSEGNGGPKCLIIDDSVLPKTGKRIEKISRVWNHVNNRYVLGFKILVCMYWEGTSCIPIDFSLHREKGKNKDKPYGLKKKEQKKLFRKNRDKSLFGYKRAKEADMSKIDSAIEMIKRAFKKRVEVDYVLMDSWFTCWKFVDLVTGRRCKKAHLIGMYKTAKTKFDFSGQQLTHSQIRNQLGTPVRCRKLRYYYKQSMVGWNNKPIKLFFSKQGKNGKWKVFLTTNTALSFIEMIRIYQIRWSIEVFFKESKQLLGLGKCQSNDFDAQIADTAMVMIQHLILTLRFRYEHYESKGAIFDQDTERMIRRSLGERLWGLLLELVKIIEVLFDGYDSDEIIQKLFNNEKAADLITRLTGKEDIGKLAA